MIQCAIINYFGLNATDRAVSNWENGRRIPDISLLKLLSEIFEISIVEILNGHKMSINELKNQKELIDKLIDYENYKESGYLSKQGKLVPIYNWICYFNYSM